ncbi:MAG: M28 family peptidase, partial [Lentihominibacter sp.]
MMYMDENSIRCFDAEVDKLTADNYGKKIVQELCSYGTSDIGYRLGGTWAEKKAADYVVKEFRDMGINVKKEAIPTDSFDLKGAWVTVNGRKITGSQIAGFRGTPEEGLTAQVVYVGTGTRAEYDASSEGENYYDDKIVLVDNVFDTEWIGWQSSEATVQGALGVILTSAGRENEVYFSYADDMITGQDGQNMVSDVPLLYIPKKDGDWIKSALCESDEPVVVNMCSIVDITKAEDGGTGYNVIAEIPGKSGCNEEIMFCAHMDAHLRAAGDDTGALATVMMIAKAMKLSGYEPDYTVKFFITSSEEYGVGNTMYDWQHGAFYAFAKQHPEWSGKIAAMFNYEVMPEKNGVLEILSEQELCGNMMEWLEAMKKDEALPSFPENTNVIPSVITVGDNWCATASGIPSMCMVVKAADYMTRYHSNYDREENLDYNVMRDMAKASFRMYLEYDKGIIPYSLGFRADDLSGLFNDPQVSSPEWGAVFPMTADVIAENGGDERVIAEMKNEI